MSIAAAAVIAAKKHTCRWADRNHSSTHRIRATQSLHDLNNSTPKNQILDILFPLFADQGLKRTFFCVKKEEESRLL